MEKQMRFQPEVWAYNETGKAADIQHRVILREDGAVFVGDDLFQFLDVVLSDVGNPAMLMTNAQLKRAVFTEATARLEEMKKNTVGIVTHKFPELRKK